VQQGHSIQRQWRAGARTHPHLESFGRVSAPGRITDFAALLQTVFSAASHRQPAAGAATPSTPRPRPTRMCRLWVASDMGRPGRHVRPRPKCQRRQCSKAAPQAPVLSKSPWRPACGSAPSPWLTGNTSLRGDANGHGEPPSDCMGPSVGAIEMQPPSWSRCRHFRRVQGGTRGLAQASANSACAGLEVDGGVVIVGLPPSVGPRQPRGIHPVGLLSRPSPVVIRCAPPRR